jgi:hypothetical protein
MATVNLTDFASQQAELARRQKMADLLQQQASAPIEVQSYKGIQAPIPWTAVLAKALGQYVADNQDRKIQGESAQNAKAARDQAAQFLQTQQTEPGLTQGLPQVPANLQGPGIIDRLKGMVPQRTAPQAMGDALAGGPPPVQPMPGAQPQMPPPQAAPQPQMASAPQPMPQGPVSPMAPVTAPPVQAPIQDHQRSMAEQQQRLMQASFSGNPYLEKLAPSLYQSNQAGIDRKAELADKTAEAQAAAKADQDRAVAIAHAMPNLTDSQRNVAVMSAMATGTKGVQSTLDLLAKDGFTATFRKATDQELAGYPTGTTGQVNAKTGELTHVYNPSSDLNAAAQLKISQANLGIAGAHLALDRNKFAADQDAKQNGVFDAPTLQQMATQAWQGDKSVFQNLGRGQQGAQNIVGLRKEIYAQGAMMGKTGKDLAQMNANFVGETAQQRAVGSRVGNAAVGASEVPLLAQIADQSYAKLSRAELVPYNRLKQMVESGTSSPAQAAAYAADQSVVNAFARAISPTGVGTDAARAKGEKMLNTAMGPEAHRAVLNQLITETNAIKSGAAAAMGTGQQPAAQLEAKPDAPTPEQAAALAKYGPH